MKAGQSATVSAWSEQSESGMGHRWYSAFWKMQSLL